MKLLADQDVAPGQRVAEAMVGDDAGSDACLDEHPPRTLYVNRKACLREWNRLVELNVRAPKVLLERVEEIEPLEIRRIDGLEGAMNEVRRRRADAARGVPRNRDEVFTVLDPHERGARRRRTDDAELSNARADVQHTPGTLADQEPCGSRGYRDRSPELGGYLSGGGREHLVELGIGNAGPSAKAGAESAKVHRARPPS